jgi:hypothetical protein
LPIAETETARLSDGHAKERLRPKGKMTEPHLVNPTSGSPIEGTRLWIQARELAASGASLSEIANELARAEAATKALTEPRTHALLKSSVTKIIWAQAGRVTEPGRYMFNFGWLTVSAEDLAIWKQYPNAAFTLLRTTPAEEAEDEFRLGTFELRENISLSEK